MGPPHAMLFCNESGATWPAATPTVNTSTSGTIQACRTRLLHIPRLPYAQSRNNNYVTNDEIQVRFRARQDFLVVKLNPLLMISDSAQNIHLLWLGKLRRPACLGEHLQ